MSGIGLHCLPNYKLGERGHLKKKSYLSFVLQRVVLNYNCE